MAASSLDPHVSSLAADPELAELVAEFIAELPHRIAAMTSAAVRQDWAEVRRLAHQLKGAGGSYGVPEISETAGMIEKAASEGTPVIESIRRLRELCVAASQY